MGYVSHPFDSSIGGPWLLDRKSFEELNEVLLIIDEKLNSAWNENIENKVRNAVDGEDITDNEILDKIKEERASPWNNKHKNECSLTSKDGVKIIDENVMGLLRDVSLVEFSPVSFNSTIEHGSSYENSFELNIKSTYSKDLDYKIKCFNSEISKEIKYEIDRWIEKYQPSRVVSVWAGEFSGFLSFMMFVPIVFALLYLAVPQYTSYKKDLTEEAHKIIANGVDHGNEHRAIQLLLEETFNYTPKSFVPKKKKKSSIIKRNIFLALVLFLVFSIRPKTTIGLGKFKFRRMAYRRWVQLVTVTVPIALLVTPLWEKIVTLIYP